MSQDLNPIDEFNCEKKNRKRYTRIKFDILTVKLLLNMSNIEKNMFTVLNLPHINDIGNRSTRRKPTLSHNKTGTASIKTD
jgi:hypothetical protein